MSNFRELKVWQRGIELAKEIYKTTHAMPSSETFALQGQMRRAAVSISSNIAEGSKRSTRKDFVHFLHVADGSAAELETQIIIAKDSYPKLDFSRADALLDEVQKMLLAMRRSLSPTTNYKLPTPH